jgi:hypothetical protein
MLSQHLIPDGETEIGSSTTFNFDSKTVEKSSTKLKLSGLPLINEAFTSDTENLTQLKVTWSKTSQPTISVSGLNTSDLSLWLREDPNLKVPEGIPMNVEFATLLEVPKLSAFEVAVNVVVTSERTNAHVLDACVPCFIFLALGRLKLTVERLGNGH